MATDKDKLMRGARFLAIAFPFIFMGPSLMFMLGIPAMRQDNIWWMAVSIAVMGIAAFFGVRGILTVLSAFFDKS